jgi:hypothetical protein
VKQLRPDLPQVLADAIMKSLEKDRNLRFRLVDDFANALLPFAPPWYRQPAPTSGRSSLAPARPAHLSNSLAESMEDERTVADPNAAPDALRPAPNPAQLGFDQTTRAPSPIAETSQPGAVARTTAGGDRNKKSMSDAGRLVIAIASGVAVAMLALAIFLIVNRSSAPTQTTDPPPPQPTTFGKIAVEMASGTCAIRVDGVDRGNIPPAGVEVTPGEHLVKCTTPNGSVKEQRVSVSVGQTAKVTFTGI